MLMDEGESFIDFDKHIEQKFREANQSIVISFQKLNNPASIYHPLFMVHAFPHLFYSRIGSPQLRKSVNLIYVEYLSNIPEEIKFQDQVKHLMKLGSYDMYNRLKFPFQE